MEFTISLKGMELPKHTGDEPKEELEKFILNMQRSLQVSRDRRTQQALRLENKVRELENVRNRLKAITFELCHALSEDVVRACEHVEHFLAGPIEEQAAFEGRLNPKASLTKAALTRLKRQLQMSARYHIQIYIGIPSI